MQTSLDAPNRVLANFILSSGTNLGADAPPELGEELKKDWRAVISELMASGVSATSKVEHPEIIAFIEGGFRNTTNFTDEVFWASVADPNGVFGWNISDRLKDTKQPTLIIASEEDGATSPAQNQFLANNIPGAKIKFYRDVGHFCQIENRPCLTKIYGGLLRKSLEIHWLTFFACATH